ncbi:Hypothetical predicted protein, partial [Paramuricea clavata]
EISLEKYQDFIKTGISDISHLEDVSEDDIEDFKFLIKFEFKRLLWKYKAHKDSLHLQKTETIILNNSTRAGNVDAKLQDVQSIECDCSSQGISELCPNQRWNEKCCHKNGHPEKQFKNLWSEHPKNPTHYFSNSFILHMAAERMKFVQTLHQCELWCRKRWRRKKCY